MTVKELMEYRRAVPFRPFVVRLKDSQEFSVLQPEHISGDTKFSQIGVAADEDSVATVDIDAVAEVRLLPDRKEPRRRNGKGRQG